MGCEFQTPVSNYEFELLNTVCRRKKYIKGKTIITLSGRKEGGGILQKRRTKSRRRLKVVLRGQTAQIAGSRGRVLKVKAAAIGRLEELAVKFER